MKHEEPPQNEARVGKPWAVYVAELAAHRPAAAERKPRKPRAPRAEKAPRKRAASKKK